MTKPSESHTLFIQEVNKIRDYGSNTGNRIACLGIISRLCVNTSIDSKYIVITSIQKLTSYFNIDTEIPIAITSRQISIEFGCKE